MENRKSFVSAVVFAAAFGWLAVGISSAGDYYVSFSGSDLAGSGSVTNPWRTINHALASIPAPTSTESQTIHIGPGYWNSGPLEPFPLDVPQGVILEGAGIDLTILAGIVANSRVPVPTYGQVLVKFYWPPGGPPPGIAPAQVTNLTMSYARAAVEVVGDTNNVPEPYIYNVKFWKNQIGVQITNAAPRIEDCLFLSNNMGVSAGRITNTGPDMVLRDNRFLKNTYGINAANAMDMLIEFNWFEQNGIGCMMGTVGLVVTRPLLRNNTYFKNGQGFTGSAVLGGRLLPTMVHETFYGNNTGIASMDDTVFGGRSDPNIRNCVIWGSLDNDLNGVSQDEVVNTNLRTAVGVPVGPIIGINGIMSKDPKFVDAENGDLHLSNESPVIDKGRNDYLGVPDTDVDGDPRSTGYPDLGVDELQSLLVHNRSASRSRELRLVLTARQDPGLEFILAASYTSEPNAGIPFGDRVIPLYPDALFFNTVGFLGGVPKFHGFLNGAGQTVVLVRVPDFPSLRGQTVYLAYITLDPSCPHGIKTISNVVRVEVDTL